MENFVANNDGELVVQYSTQRARSKLMASYSQCKTVSLGSKLHTLLCAECFLSELSSRFCMIPLNIDYNFYQLYVFPCRMDAHTLS